MARTFFSNYSIQRNDEDIELEIEYTATPYVPATYWQPAEGGEIEIVEVLGPAGKGFVLTDDEESKVIDYLYESFDDDVFNDYED